MLTHTLTSVLLSALDLSREWHISWDTGYILLPDSACSLYTCASHPVGGVSSVTLSVLEFRTSAVLSVIYSVPGISRLAVIQGLGRLGYRDESTLLILKSLQTCPYHGHTQYKKDSSGHHHWIFLLIYSTNYTNWSLRLCHSSSIYVYIAPIDYSRRSHPIN